MNSMLGKAPYLFSAVLLKDDKRTGFKAGTCFDPKGIYYHKGKVILVGSVSSDHTVRLAFPVEDVEVTIKKL